MTRFKDWLGRNLFPGVEQQVRHARREPAHADEPVEEFLDPYTAGEEYRRRYLEHTTDEAAVAAAAESAVEGRVTPGSRPLTHYKPPHWPRTAWPTWRGDSR